MGGFLVNRKENSMNLAPEADCKLRNSFGNNVAFPTDVVLNGEELEFYCGDSDMSIVLPWQELKI